MSKRISSGKTPFMASAKVAMPKSPASKKAGKGKGVALPKIEPTKITPALQTLRKAKKKIGL